MAEEVHGVRRARGYAVAGARLGAGVVGRSIQTARRNRAMGEAMLRARLGGGRVTFDIDPTVRFDGPCYFVALPGTSSQVSIGPRTQIGRDVRINLRGGSVAIGSGVDVRRLCTMNVEGDLVIGDQVSLSVGVYIHCSERVEMGNMSGAGEFATIADSNHVRTPEDVPFQSQIRSAPVLVGRNAWIGTKAVVTAGVEIGEMAFVGANSVVTKSVEPWWLVAGIPARPIRRLEVET